MHETKIVTTRTLYVAECKCGNRTELDRNPPRERRCECGEWVTFEEVSFTGPDRFN